MPPISRVFLFLFPLLCVLLGTACPAKGAHCSEIAPTLADLERRFACDISLAALDVQGGQKVLYRADNRFAFCSTFKFFLVAEVLRKADADRSLVGKRLFWKENEEQEWSPATRGRGGEGMSVIALCEAAMTLSDNTAANLLLRLLGGPFAMTKCMRALGDRDFLLCDYEPRLNYTGTELANRGENRLPQAFCRPCAPCCLIEPIRIFRAIFSCSSQAKQGQGLVASRLPCQRGLPSSTRLARALATCTTLPLCDTQTEGSVFL